MAESAVHTRISARVLAGALDQPPPTDEQVEVIEAPLEPVLVVAGAGAGKTETMASRVVWLVANRLVEPDAVLGLTFTRKAAQELAARIRRRLSMLAGSSAMSRWDPEGDLRAQLRSADPQVSTYHAYAGRLIADYGLLLPVEPSASLLSETELWQLAFSVVGNWSEDLDTPKTPGGVTEAVLKLYGELSEHLVDLDQLAAAGDDLYRLIDTLPPVGRQKPTPPVKLKDIQAAIDERRQLVPLVAALGQAMRDANVLDFGSQMSLAAKLVTTHPEVAQAERAAIGAVLLDEYQDTGHSQRVLLSQLFGTPPGVTAGAGIAVTAVGDPIQSIYGWRGASAANLPRFTTDFRCSDGSPARRLELLTSWRNARYALDMANAASDELRRRGVPVSILRPRDDAPRGTIDMALTDTVADERTWIVDQIEREYNQAEGKPPTVAILVRRNQDSAPLAAQLADRGIAAEVVGIGGLLGVPEVQDVVAMLRLMSDPMAGTAAVRLLTGPRWRIGARDLAALWARARDLAAGTSIVSGTMTSLEELDSALDSAVPSETVDQAGLGDALADPGPAARYSPDGYRRIKLLGHQLSVLRARMGGPLPELVAEVERVTGVDVEAQIRARGLRGNITGREHLDAFAEYVANYAERSAATLPGLLAFLASAADIEKGLEPGKVEIAEDRVQILTVHAAKGLEWDIVVIAHLCTNIFPGGKAEGTWLKSARELPAELRGDLADSADGEGFPPLVLDGLENRKELEESIEAHQEALRARKLEEDRRLLYVALTRTKRALIISGHHWSPAGDKPKGPSVFLTELHEIAQSLIETSHDGAPGLTIAQWAPQPDEGAENPLAMLAVGASWPADPLGPRRPGTERGADLVRAALRERGEPALFAIGEDDAPEPGDDDPQIREWANDLAVLLTERSAGLGSDIEVTMPQHLSVSQLVELDKDSDAFARRLRRPLPFKPNPMARRGTAFHAWVERRFGATRLLDIDELPGAADAEGGSDADLDVLREAFLRSDWSARNPVEVEVPFETVIADTIIRGRIDAVFAEPDGGYTVVDWKTGAKPTPAQEHSVFVQLAAYRVAWAELTGTDLDKVRAAFHYVRSNSTLRPRDLPDRARLAALIRREKGAS
ncbi:ATP-dependent DNA helicase [Nocardia sp. 348MFTsu5.1]|uniref:ATP-dependent helicase n=1 Tax=Nocardia sp. 348MFTsu5.1 TaxID=1172185 RepID=UPI00055ABDD8|nr:ATP-dependent DNA helicase [Nocardia sp. 348MFTsu5.1]